MDYWFVFEISFTPVSDYRSQYLVKVFEASMIIVKHYGLE